MIDQILQIAIEAGNKILVHYQAPMDVKTKSGGSPLTQADLDANEIIASGLKKLAPEIPIISEESDYPAYEQRRHWNRFWLVDPLDGTKEFVERQDEFTVNIALIEKGEPVLGVIYAPAKPVLYFAEKGKGAWRRRGEETVRIFSSDPNKKGPVTVAVSKSHATNEIEEIKKIRPVLKTISAGSSLKFCLVAEGTADLYLRFGPTMEWDVAAGDCIYRNSAAKGEHQTTLLYNKMDLKNGGFAIGTHENWTKAIVA